jgi:hypothetical protein
MARFGRGFPVPTYQVQPRAAPPAGPPQFESVATTDVATTSTWALNLPAPLAAGDTLLALLGSDRNTTTTVTTAPAGWAPVNGTSNPQRDLSGEPADCLAFFYSKLLVPGDPELSGTNPAWVLASASAGWGVIARYSGAGGIDAAASIGDVALASHPLPAITTTAAQCLLVAGAIVDKTSSTAPGVYWTPPAGFTERLDAESATFVEVTFADQVAAAAGTSTSGLAFTGADGDNGVLFALALAPVAAGGGTNYTQAITDAVGVADQAVQAATFAQAPTDPLAVADAAAQQATASRSQTDPLALADSVAYDKGALFTLTDPVAVADSVSQQADTARAQTDPLALADLTAGVQAVGQAVTDPVAVTDTGQAVDRGLTLTDPVAIADSVSQSATGPILYTLTDPLAITDTAVQALDAGRAQTDPLALADSQSRAQERPLADPVALADTPSSVQQASQALTDPLAITDATSQQFSGTTSYTLTDPLAITDSRVVEQAATRGQTDPVALADSASRVLDAAPQLVDPVTLADSRTQAAATARAIADLLTLTDTPSYLLGGPASQTITDTLGITDQVVYVVVDVSPRWVEGASSATDLVEGASGGTGMVEGASAGTGVVEGAASI